MPDAIFSEQRLADIYDVLDGDRVDLDPYLSMAKEFGVQSVLDIGCGTGTLACLLAERGMTVTAVDPAAASLDVAHRKPHAYLVRWIGGDATALPPLRVDLVTMTGNVAQVFLADEDWNSTLNAGHAALHPRGQLIFETRDPAAQEWLEWTREASLRHVEIPGGGDVEAWVEVTDVSPPFIKFRHTFTFGTDQVTIISDSTLRFRTQTEIERSLRDSSFVVREIRDAPDRSGRELVFIAAPADS
jgi:ubiquinone/menaquinone biosynthesis C-methylase UbiE